ncbi:WRKY transcription factor 55-like [Olea europaea var. sylvestris]|uniref:WRKY transcription factor 55-like n=1 Tax=Olea europaea var. sylvestris TaxID=158386 RepID=UPI000C1D0F85|nr:WRKY transcription factor 55-like [Olea europaea var. sylvestris]
MEETMVLMLYGSKLAKDIEENLPNLCNQPDILVKSCDGIIGVFSNLKELLSHGHMISGGSNELQQTDNIGAGIQEWLKTGGNCYHQAMDLHNAQTVLGNYPRTYGFSESCTNMKVVLGRQESGLELMISGRNVESSVGGIGGEIIQPVDVDASDSGRASSSQCKRRRKDDGHKIRVIRVAAPQMGNLDLPPEDGYTWKKYGQKEILRSRYPSTSSSVITTHWLSMDIKPSVLEPTTSISNVQMFHEPGGTRSTTAGTLASGHFPEYQALPVADMANAMFNSGSSSSIGIENIFSSMEDKWNTGENKN